MIVTSGDAARQGEISDPDPMTFLHRPARNEEGVTVILRAETERGRNMQSRGRESW